MEVIMEGEGERKQVGEQLRGRGGEEASGNIAY